MQSKIRMIIQVHIYLTLFSEYIKRKGILLTDKSHKQTGTDI